MTTSRPSLRFQKAFSDSTTVRLGRYLECVRICVLSCDSISTAEPESNLLHKHFYIRQKSTLPHVTVSKNHAATKLGGILALHDVTTAQHSVTKNQKQGQAANKGATEELREEGKRKKKSHKTLTTTQNWHRGRGKMQGMRVWHPEAEKNLLSEPIAWMVA